MPHSGSGRTTLFWSHLTAGGRDTSLCLRRFGDSLSALLLTFDVVRLWPGMASGTSLRRAVERTALVNRAHRREAVSILSTMAATMPPRPAAIPIRRLAGRTREPVPLGTYLVAASYAVLAAARIR